MDISNCGLGTNIKTIDAFCASDRHVILIYNHLLNSITMHSTLEFSNKQFYVDAKHLELTDEVVLNKLNLRGPDQNEQHNINIIGCGSVARKGGSISCSSGKSL